MNAGKLRKAIKASGLLDQNRAPSPDPFNTAGSSVALLPVLVIIGVLATLAVDAYTPLFNKVMLAELSLHTGMLKREMVVRKVTQGSWPEAVDVGNTSNDNDHIRITDETFDAGNFNIGFVFRREPETRYQLEFTLVDSSETFFWVCGYGENSRHLAPSPTGSTTVPTEYLISTCR